MPDGREVHFGCLRHWLIDDALSRNFPGITARERAVIKSRLELDTPHRPRLRTLEDVGAAMGWTLGMRASQVQGTAMARLNEARERSNIDRDAHLSLDAAVAAAKEFVRLAEAESETP
jgi:DNA-directed RNA polymerase sigma subunit (sigma70/sigma32)